MLMIIGAFLVCVLVWCILLACWEEHIDKSKKIVKSVFILLGVLLPISITAIIYSMGYASKERSIANIYAERELIIDSVYNERLVDIEASEIIKEANEINARIIKLQFEKKGWGGFLIPDEVNDLELIDFK